MAEEKYITLGKQAEAQFEEKHSLFIGYATPAKSEEEAMAFVAKIKAKHRDATHNVYAYHLKRGIYVRQSDDGEPQGTAGMPVLDVIRKSGVDDACVVVTRYFGGTLLGAGGLVRAYSAAAKLAIEASGIVCYESYTELETTLGYSDYQKFAAELPRFAAIVDDTQYAEGVTLRFAVKSELAEKVIGRIREMTAGKSEAKTIGTRFDAP